MFEIIALNAKDLAKLPVEERLEAVKLLEELKNSNSKTEEEKAEIINKFSLIMSSLHDSIERNKKENEDNLNPIIKAIFENVINDQSCSCTEPDNIEPVIGSYVSINDASHNKPFEVMDVIKHYTSDGEYVPLLLLDNDVLYNVDAVKYYGPAHKTEEQEPEFEEELTPSQELGLIFKAARENINEIISEHINTVDALLNVKYVQGIANFELAETWLREFVRDKLTEPTK